MVKMLFHAVTTLAVAALAGQAVAEPAPYKPNQPSLVMMSVRSALGRRDDSFGYQTETSYCGLGSTCSEACGESFAQCPSDDDNIHCYDAGHSSMCCPNKSGASCDVGFYCSADDENNTWCCPVDMDAESCAAAVQVTGGLSSQIALVTTTVYQQSSTSIPVVSTTPAAYIATTVAPYNTTTAAYNTSTVACNTSTSEPVITQQIVQTVLPTPAAATGANTTRTAIGTTGITPTSVVPAPPVLAGASSVQGAMGLTMAMAVVGIAALF